MPYLTGNSASPLPVSVCKVWWGQSFELVWNIMKSDSLYGLLNCSRLKKNSCINYPCTKIVAVRFSTVTCTIGWLSHHSKQPHVGHNTVISKVFQMQSGWQASDLVCMPNASIPELWTMVCSIQILYFSHAFVAFCCSENRQQFVLLLLLLF